MKTLYSVERFKYKTEWKDLNVINVENEWLVYNFVTYGWGILNKDELERLFNLQYANDKFCRKLYKAGLIKLNGQYVYAHTAELDETITYFEISITNVCNIQCKYCVSNFNFCEHSMVMNKETALNIINEIRKYIAQEGIESIVIEFSGGEPLLNFRIIQEFVNNLKSIECNITYVIQTNGVLFDEDKIQFIKKNENIQLAISIDGINEKQNSNRLDKNNQPILEKVMFFINKIRSNNIPFSIVSVISKENLNDIEQIVKYFIENNLTETFSLLPLLPFGVANKNDIHVDTEKYINAILDLHSNYLIHENMKVGKNIVERNMGVISSYLFSPNRSYICNQNPCGAGRKIVSIGPNGKVYPCYGFQEIEEFCLGNINEKFMFSEIKNSSVMKRLHMRNVEEIEKCKGCNYKIWCNGGCTSNAYLASQDIMQRDDIYCIINKNIIEKILYEYINNEKMVDYLKKIKKVWDII